MKNLYVCLNNSSEPILNGELYSKVKVDDSLWSIEDGNQLLLTLEKA